MRTPTITLLAIAALLSAETYSAFAEEASMPSPESYQLANGLQVILAPDHKVPKVSLNLQYHVGSMTEPAGRSGFAHLFEHLMILAGTPSYPKADATFTAAGIDFNGFTMEDSTTYVLSGMASTLPVMLSAYADQMANIGASVDQADLDLQRSVVLNEMRQNVLDSPGMSAVTALQSAMFPAGHPYSHAVIGSIPDLEAATLDDVRAFFSAYYGPNNAVLVLVGDFDVAATKDLIEDTFGRIPRGADVVQPKPARVQPTATRIEAVDALAAPLVYLAFNGPDALSKENAALYMAADLLSNESGVLRAQLVNTGIATGAGAAWSPGELGGRFTIYASAGPGVTADQLEAALKKSVSDFLAAPVDSADLDRTRSAMLLGIRAQLEVYSTRASVIAATQIIEGNVNDVFEDDADIVAATAADVEATSDAVLDLDAASIAVVQPGPRGDYPAVLRDASGVAVPIEVAQRAIIDIPVLAAGDPVAAHLPERETATLSNGIEVVHYRMTGSPLFYVAASVTGGTNNDPRGKEGLYTLAADMAWRGAGDRDLEALGRAAKDVGAVVGSWSGSVMSGANMSVPPANLAAGIDLLADVIQKPRFASAEWEIVRAGALNALIQRDSDLTSVAQRALAQVIFFPAPEDSGVSMTLASVSSITLDEAKAAFEDMVTPRTMVINTAGDLPIEDVVKALETRFGSGWHDDDAGIAAKPALQAVFPATQRVYLAPMPGTSQATIYIARPAPGSADPSYPSAVAVSNLLAADFSGRLNSVIREQKGYSYGVSGALWDWYEHDSALTVTIPVQIDATGPALAEVFTGFDSLVARPVTDIEVTRSVSAYQTALASLPETAAAFFGAVVSMQMEGIDIDETLAYADRMTRLDLAEVQAEAARLAPLDRAVIVISGDPDRILPQLRAMGITDVGTITLPTGVMPAAVKAN